MAARQPVIVESTIRCPNCGTTKVEVMPTDACQYFYDCAGCGALLKPKPGDCCVFCSYGTVPAETARRRVLLHLSRQFSRSMMIAGAMPPPAHIVTRPRFRSRRSSSSSIVPINIEPVAPIG